MDHNVTQKNKNTSKLFTDKNDEDDNDCLSRLKRSRRALSAEEEEILSQLDSLQYQPPEYCVQAVLAYGEKKDSSPETEAGPKV